MISLLKIEKATQDGKFIGYRLTVGDESTLIFQDQVGMPGFRFGKRFNVSLGKEIEYWEIPLSDGSVSDTERLDYLEKYGMPTQYGMHGHRYWNVGRSMQEYQTLREALDAGIKAHRESKS